MPKKSDYDTERLRHVLQAQHQVITRVQALACGMPQSTLDRYIAPGGRWQRLLPGVYLAVTGAATQTSASWRRCCTRAGAACSPDRPRCAAIGYARLGRTSWMY
jgi:hypothetical protein